MIPKVDGDSTPSGQRPYASCLLPEGYGPLFGSLISKIGFRAGFHRLCSVLEMGDLRLKPGFPPHWILRRFCLVREGISCML